MQSKDTQLPDGTSLARSPCVTQGSADMRAHIPWHTPGFCGRSVSDRSKEVSDLAPHASVWLGFWLITAFIQPFQSIHHAIFLCNCETTSFPPPRMPPFKAHEVGHQWSMAKVVKHRCLERRCPSRGVQNAGSDGATENS